ncbi:MAG TPA: hypothetical protein VKP04_07450 [Ktedonobacteraceae bacterium]|nr:hypothetical protein [Ktedonobacteraceae bacterium]
MNEPVITTIPDPDTVNINIQQSVSNAAQLGWAFAELLGRCFMLPGLYSVPASEWKGDQLIPLRELSSPREELNGLMIRINFLVDSLNLSSMLVNNENDPNHGSRFVDILRTNIKLLCETPLSDSSDSTHQQILGKINKYLFEWNLTIQEALQVRPKAVFKAYIVGRSLASLRWCFGFDNWTLDRKFIEKICHEYIPALSPYLSPFVPGAIANSVMSWGYAIVASSIPPVFVQLEKQADIWYALLISERDPLSYVSKAYTAKRNTWKVLGAYSPLFIISGLTICFILGLLLVVLLSNVNTTVKVTIAVGILPLLGITQTIVTVIANILQTALTDTSKGSALDDMRNVTLQQAVNAATLILPPSRTTGPRILWKRC